MFSDPVWEERKLEWHCVDPSRQESGISYTNQVEISDLMRAKGLNVMQETMKRTTKA